jgi:uncharacterized protein (DUF885 family)
MSAVCCTLSVMSTEAGSRGVSELADDLVQSLFDADPVRATLSGFHDRDAALPDLSDEAERALAGSMRRLASRADDVDRADLPVADRLTLDVVRAVATDTAEVADARKPEWQVTDLWVGPAASMLIFLPMLTLTEPAHAEAYLDRLGGLDGYLAEAADRHRAGVEAGRTPVARLVRAAVQQIDNYLGAPDSDPLAQLQPPAGWDHADRFRSELGRVLAGTVRPAFRRYRDTLAAAVVPHGRDDERVGLGWLPGGEDLYRVLVRSHTTTLRTAEELHRTGLDLVGRLGEEYAELGGRVFGSAEPAEVMRRLRDDPDLRCSSAEQMLDEARRAVARAEQAAPRWFGRVPEQRCRVEPVPEPDAARSPGAFYVPASLDGSRPGTYFQNTSQPAEQHRHLVQSAAYHEAVPGHHLQSALAQGMPDRPLLRRIIEFNAYDEGWALYCERLADEMGLYTDDLARLGMLAGDSLRAGRLVVDTGMHALGWSRAQAIDFLYANSPLPLAGIEVEVDRYIADPGQALAYMVGRLEIKRLRAEAERRLGPEFDIRAFHDTVLGTGSLPLTTLASHVHAWLGAGARSEAAG